MSFAKLCTACGMLGALALSTPAQLLMPTNLSVVKVGKTEFSQGKVDSLTKMLAMQQLQGQSPTDEIMRQVRWAVIDNLVGQEMLRLEADRQKLSAPAKRVDSLLTVFKSQFPSEEAFTKELKKSGTSLSDFKDKIKRQLESDLLLEKAVPYPNDPTEAEKKAYFEKHKGEAKLSDTISGVQVFLKLEKGESAQSINDKKQILAGLAAQWRTRKNKELMQSVQSFQMIAAQYSDDPEAKTTGGMMKPFLAKDEGAEFAKAVKSLKVGEVSEAFVGKNGPTIFLMTEKNDGKYESYAHKVEYILKVEAERARQQKIKSYLDGLSKVYPVQYLNKDYTPPQAIGAGK